MGADMVAYTEAEEVLEHKEAGMATTTSCCPAFVSMVRKHFPDLLKFVSTTVSPMVAVERYVRTQRPDVTTVFIGPCIAKKNEVMSGYIGELDYALTFEELYAMLCAKDIEPSEVEPEAEDATRYGKGFALSGGVTKAVQQVWKERAAEGREIPEISAIQCNGAEECRKALMLLKAGKLPQDFIEGMCCVGGCMGGPATLSELNKSKKVFESRLNGGDSIVENVQQKKADVPNIHRHG